jgi:hypothetical protein
MAVIGNFTIQNGWLTANSNVGQDVGYINLLGTNTRIAFGRNLLPTTATYPRHLYGDYQKRIPAVYYQRNRNGRIGRAKYSSRRQQ